VLIEKAKDSVREGHPWVLPCGEKALCGYVVHEIFGLCPSFRHGDANFPGNLGNGMTFVVCHKPFRDNVSVSSEEN
jgi:hypothetical protein